MICPQCGKLIGVGEDRCPFCGAWRPGMWGWTPVLQRVIGRRVDLVGLVVRACLVLYVVGLALDLPGALRPGGLFSLLSPSGRALYQLGMTGGVAWTMGHWWTVFTAIYLHGGLLHIFFNLMWVRQLLPEVEEAYGLARAFIIFTVSGVAGFLLSNVMMGTPTVGASGSIFGMLAAAIVHLRRGGGAWAGLMARQMWQWAVILFLMGFLMSGVNNLAHLGGFLGGYGSAWWFSRLPGRGGRAALLATVLIAACTLAGFVASFVMVTGLILLGR
jgi:rhomboid protease GluP